MAMDWKKLFEKAALEERVTKLIAMSHNKETLRANVLAALRARELELQAKDDENHALNEEIGRLRALLVSSTVSARYIDGPATSSSCGAGAEILAILVAVAFVVLLQLLFLIFPTTNTHNATRPVKMNVNLTKRRMVQRLDQH